MFDYKFISSKLTHWSQTNYNENIVWSAGLHPDQVNKYIEAIIKSIKNKNRLLSFLDNLDDNFGIVYFSDDFAFIAVDTIRSFPIYYSRHQNTYYFSPQADEINKLIRCEIDDEQRIAFQMSGYTISNKTLWKNIKSVTGGTALSFPKNDKPIEYKYFLYKPWENNEIKNIDFKTKLKTQIHKIIKNLINTANGKTIIIPLSAGLDSRLIVSGLKHHGYEKVKCFSYGRKNNYESRAAKKISSKLGYSWKFCEINRINIENFYKSNIFKEFILKTNDGVATQGIQDVYAIYHLMKAKYINKGDIIVNGNSGDFISGGHIPIELENYNKKKLTIKNILDLHIKKHYSLWGTLFNKKNKDIINKLLINQIEELQLKDKKNINYHGLLEFLEFQNRQCKYVINLQRTYDFYELKWKLPLWDKNFISFWSTVPLTLKLKQKLYKKVLKEINFSGVWENKYDYQYKIPSLSIYLLRIIFKSFHIFSSKAKWHKFERRYISYWTDNLYGMNVITYKEIIKNTHDARNSVSWLTLNSEKLNLGYHWQKIKKIR